MNQEISGFSKNLYAGIFLTAMSVLVLQVALTRVFAVLMWYHFAYLVVSLALLGFGASGSLLTRLRVTARPEREIINSLSVYALLFGLAVIASFFIVTRIEVNSFQIWSRPLELFKLLAVFLLLSVPFLLAGLAIGACLSKYPDNIGRLYFSDLVGSALGAVVTPTLLALFGSAVAVITAAFIALLGALVFALRADRARKAASLCSLAACFLLAVGLGAGFLRWEIPFAPNKIHSLIFEKLKNEKVLPSAIAQVNISRPTDTPPFLGGDIGAVDLQNVTARVVTQDGTAPTGLFKNAADVRRFPWLDDTQAASAFVALGTRGRLNPDVLVIGVGGGVDVMIALFHGASSVTAVEINSAMIRMVTREYPGFIGRLFDDPRVRTVHEDGRSFLHRTGQKFDVIQLSGVDTFTALSTGAYTLSESYLYTVEAVKEMYSRLKQGGYINYSRIVLPGKPRETIRLVNIAYEALDELAVDEPARNLAVVQGHKWASIMIRKGPIPRKEVESLIAFSKKEGFKGLLYHPYLGGKACEAASSDPDFARMRKYFLELLGGTEERRRAFMDGYLYDLEASRDDRPFFFNFFRLSKFTESFEPKSDFSFVAEYLPKFPVGHMVLMSSLFLITILAVLMIIFPLGSLPGSIGNVLRLQTLAYFASLGMGFMFIEICMMQRFVLFLGSPVYSMSVVLGGILAFSGLGAALSTRFEPSRATITRLALIILFLSLFNAFALEFVLEPIFGLSLGLRIAATLLLLAPTALVLGMPFPLGIRMLKERGSEIIPWAWGINGFLSVFSSIMATVVAMASGFTGVVLIAGGVYAVGLSLAPVRSACE